MKISILRRRRSGESPARPTQKISSFWKSLAVLSGSAVLLTGCALTPNLSDYSAENPAVLRYADYAPATASGPFDEFARMLNENTDGRLEVNPYWGGSLLGSKDLPSGTRAGVADIGIFTATAHASEYPVTSWLTPLGSVGSQEFPEGILQTYAGFADYVYNSKEVNKQFDDLGLKVLAPLHTILNYSMICTSPVTNLKEAEGKRVRSGGPLWDGEIRAAGMIPVTLSVEESYEALQRGVVDCAIANPRTAMTYGFWDIAKYYTEMPFSGINAQYIVMNQTSWDALAEEDQQILWDASYTWWSENMQQDGIAEYLKFYEVGGEEQGITFLQADPKLAGVINDYQTQRIDTMSQDAPSIMENPQREVDDYRERMDSWLKTVEEIDLGDDKNNPDLDEYFHRTKTEIWDEETL